MGGVTTSAKALFAGVEPGPPLRGPVTEEMLREITRRIVHIRPQSSVVLFGSRARKTQRAVSDIDLLVLTSVDEGQLQIAAELNYALGDRDFGIDIIVMSPGQFRARLAGRDPLVAEVVREGRVLHGRLP